MRQIIKEMKEKLKDRPGVKMQLEIPRDLYHRVQALAITDEARSNEKIFKRDKVLECLLAGVETLETAERKTEV